MNFGKTLGSLLCTYLLFLSLSSQALTLFKVGDIEGGYQGPNYDGWSIAKGLTGNFSEGECDQLMLEKEVDKASVKYIEAAVFGTVFEKVEIYDLREFSGALKPETIIEIANAKISQVKANKPEGEPLGEIISIEPVDMRIEFRAYDRDGNPQGNVATTINCGYKAK